jgi:2,4-dienoyl-CoA reductase (NADPH2)
MIYSPWPLKKRIAVIGGGLPGCELVKELMDHRKLTIFEERKKIGWDVGGSDRFHIVNGFKKSPNVTLKPLTKIKAISKEGVTAVSEDNTEFFTPADTVAVTLGFEQNLTLADALKKKAKEVYIVGDCINPSRMADATKAGYIAACKL